MGAALAAAPGSLSGQRNPECRRVLTRARTRLSVTRYDVAGRTLGGVDDRCESPVLCDARSPAEIR
jgi:hypothetical protein